MKKFATILSSIILAVILFSAGNTEASSLYAGTSITPGIQSLVYGVAKEEWGGSMQGSILDGKNLDYLYCVDLFTVVWHDQTYASTTVNNEAKIHNSPLLNAGSVAYLLSNYGLAGAGGGVQGQALQAAIWYEVNGRNSKVYELDSTAYAGSQVLSLYNKYVAEAANNIGNISDFLWITPADIVGRNDAGEEYQGLVTIPPVPEPGTMMLLGFGMLGLAIYGKRRANKEA